MSDVSGSFRVWPMGSCKPHIKSILIGQFSGLSLRTDGQQVLSSLLDVIAILFLGEQPMIIEYLNVFLFFTM